MPSIESLGHPLVYKAADNVTAPLGFKNKDIAVRAEVRALEGMQKEALVYYGPTGTVWRMVSDEGPYLNGTDLAPFPLASYTTGMALSFTEELLRHARESGVSIDHYQLTQDNRYTMEGSAIRGDMIGGALPVEMVVEITADATPELIQEIVTLAEKTSPAQTYMNEVLANTFSLMNKGVKTAVTEVNPSPNGMPPDPTPKLNATSPMPANAYAENIIVKMEAAETLFDIEGGAGSSLQAAQKRTLHVRGICTLRPDGLKEVKVQLFKPIGSTFRFLSDDSEEERAPSSLAYLSAGVGFCFMTQIGRYAHIVKHNLTGYSIVQDTNFKVNDDSAEAAPVDTHVYLQMDEPEEAAQKTLSMSERTCFLHAAMRASNKTQMTIQLNGKTI